MPAPKICPLKTIANPYDLIENPPLQQEVKFKQNEIEANYTQITSLEKSSKSCIFEIYYMVGYKNLLQDSDIFFFLKDRDI